jgi:hypothetical protein
MIVFQLNEDGFQLLLVPFALPIVTLTPVVVKSVGEVENRILNPAYAPVGVQLKGG